MKKLLLTLLCYTCLLQNSLAQKIPGIGGSGLPGNVGEDGGTMRTPTNDAFLTAANSFTAFFIQFVAVVAVLALMLSGLQLIISGGEEEKFKKAKTWFIWSLVGVLVSITAWGMVSFLNNIKIGT